MAKIDFATSQAGRGAAQPASPECNISTFQLPCYAASESRMEGAFMRAVAGVGMLDLTDVVVLISALLGERKGRMMTEERWWVSRADQALRPVLGSWTPLELLHFREVIIDAIEVKLDQCEPRYPVDRSVVRRVRRLLVSFKKLQKAASSVPADGETQPSRTMQPTESQSADQVNAALQQDDVSSASEDSNSAQATPPTSDDEYLDCLQHDPETSRNHIAGTTLPPSILSTVRDDSGVANTRVEDLCDVDFATGDFNIVIEAGGRSETEAVAYSLLSAAKDGDFSTSTTGGKYCPAAIHVVLNNAGVRQTKDIYQKLWSRMLGGTSNNLPVAFCHGFVDASFAIKKKPSIIVTTLGKLAKLLESHIVLGGTKRIVFENFTAMMLYNKDDEDIKKVLAAFHSSNRLTLFVTTLSIDLRRRFEELKPFNFELDLLKDVVFYNGHHAERLASMMQYIEFLATNTVGKFKDEEDKLRYALGLVADTLVRAATFGAQQIIVIFNFKKTLRRFADLAKELFDVDIPVLHGAEDLGERQRRQNLRGFERKKFQVLACTRRALIGCHFDFVPALVYVDIPRSMDEVFDNVFWGENMMSMRAAHSSGVDAYAGLIIKFIYDVKDVLEDILHLDYVCRELTRMGVADEEMLRRIGAMHR